MSFAGCFPPANLSIGGATPPPVWRAVQPSLIAGVPDGILALIAPVVAYWLYLTFFHLLDVYELAERYRIHPLEEEALRNKVTLRLVVQDVLVQHIVQTVVGYCVYRLDAPATVGHELATMWQIRRLPWVPAAVPDAAIWWAYTWGWPAARLAGAIVIIDLWQYWLHRVMHMNKTLYRRFHLRHHRLYVPYAYGALYNDPVEGFLLDTLGTGIAGLVTRLLARELIVLYTFATLKTVDDHCGYRLPYDIFQIIFPNNSVYHDIHHQIWGIKHNFSQPFFTVWDRMFGTEYEFVEQYRQHQHGILLQKYKEFLRNRTATRKTAAVEIVEGDERDEHDALKHKGVRGEAGRGEARGEAEAAREAVKDGAIVTGAKANGMVANEVAAGVAAVEASATGASTSAHLQRLPARAHAIKQT